MVHDRVSRCERAVQSKVARSSMLINNRRPFQTAYALSHSPWNNRDPESFVFRDVQNRLLLCRVLLSADGKSFEISETVVIDESMSSSLIWFA